MGGLTQRTGCRVRAGASRDSASCGSSPRGSEHAEELTADATTNQTSDGVADGAQVTV